MSVVLFKSRPLTDSENCRARMLIDFLQAAIREGCVELNPDYARAMREEGRKRKVEKSFSEYDLCKGIAIAYAMGAISGTAPFAKACRPDSLEEGGAA